LPGTVSPLVLESKLVQIAPPSQQSSQQLDREAVVSVGPRPLQRFPVREVGHPVLQSKK